MAAHFLLLEILDPAVNAFLWSIRRTVGGKGNTSAIHLTIGGPYQEERPAALQRAKSALRYDVLRIASVGRFSNDSEEVVFFRVDSPNLRSVWYKPSYPIGRFGFEPHISVYRGHDAGLADAVAIFLQEESLELLCAEHQLVWHESGQANLLGAPMPTVGAMDDLYKLNRIDTRVLDRLEECVDRHRKNAMVRRLG